MNDLSQPTASIDVDDIRQAAERLKPWAHITPIMSSRTLNERCGGSVVLKCENFQRIGAFKFRGAMNALLQLEDAKRGIGVVTHSSGNHAQALALAGQLLDIPVCVVMPHTAPAIKHAATKGYGARIVSCEPTLAAREAAVANEIERHGYTLIHPFDNWQVIAGQGTVAWEFLDQAGPLDMILCPVGGGGLLAGTALAVKGRSPSTKVIGAEPKRADDAKRSLASGSIESSGDPRTIADGLRTSLGVRTFSVIRHNVDAIVTATESEILDTMRFLWERFKMIVEPSSAVAVAPVLTGTLPVRDLKVGIIISGGNVDLEPLFQALATKWLTDGE
ncbi:pyridoxal-phosphate dependent enzyme [Singulisphaera acidiphila]|uniref:Threonine dehydratase n=1 Tax=Singulisphaera acidiphila (strain ATCC BAA-1392 / DSM 18658 / VKM B-2454 / MOB10) TaxID=886293 RepID=L0D993_SINAD|nr:pyridoxal-phosphate dependent enzyme [Singulisphaera acidiphila]AGA25383.1 threonine dehydratase [Singulisphaera acidiphila DSM 18658]